MNDWKWIALGFLALAVIMGLVIRHFYRKENPKQHKPAGRDSRPGKAVAAARGFARSNSYRIIAPAGLAGKNKFAQLDALVVGYFGVLGVKALGYNGEVYGKADEDQWLWVAPDGSRSYFPNPVNEASADVRVIRDALFAKKLKQVPVEVLCVFTNPKVQLALPRSTGHHTLKTFKKALKQEKYTADKGVDLDKVENALRAALQTS